MVEVDQIGKSVFRQMAHEFFPVLYPKDVVTFAVYIVFGIPEVIKPDDGTGKIVVHGHSP